MSEGRGPTVTLPRNVDIADQLDLLADLLEIEGEAKPALVAELLCLLIGKHNGTCERQTSH